MTGNNSEKSVEHDAVSSEKGTAASTGTASSASGVSSSSSAALAAKKAVQRYIKRGKAQYAEGNREVYLATIENDSMAKVSLKVFPFSSMDASALLALVSRVKDERAIRDSLGDHPFLIKTLDLCEDTGKKEWHLITEYSPGLSAQHWLDGGWSTADSSESSSNSSSSSSSFSATSCISAAAASAQSRLFSSDETTALAYIVSSAASHMHDPHSIYHFAITPSSILFSDATSHKTPDVYSARLSNFGSAKAAPDAGVSVSMQAGGLTSSKAWQHFMAPECLSGPTLGLPANANDRADVWSLGATLLALLTGQVLGADEALVETWETAARQHGDEDWKRQDFFNVEAPRLTDKRAITAWKAASEDLRELIVSCLALKPEKRPSMADISALPFVAKEAIEVIKYHAAATAAARAGEREVAASKQLLKEKKDDIIKNKDREIAELSVRPQILAKLVEDLKKKHTISDLPFIISSLESHPLLQVVCEEACFALYSIATTSSAGREACVDVGAIPLIMASLDYHDTPLVCNRACEALGAIALSAASRDTLVELRAIPRIVSCLQKCALSAKVCESACNALSNISYSENRGTLAAREVCITAGALPLIAACLHNHASLPDICEMACRTVSNLFFDSSLSLDADAIRKVLPAIVECLKQYSAPVPTACEKACVCFKQHTLWPSVCVSSLGALRNFAVSCDGRAACIAINTISLATACLQNYVASPEVCAAACAALRNLAISSEGADACITSDGPSLVVAALKRHNTCERLCVSAVAALGNFAIFASAMNATIAVDAVPIIMSCLKNHPKSSTICKEVCRALSSHRMSAAGRNACVSYGSQLVSMGHLLTGSGGLHLIAACLVHHAKEVDVCQDVCRALDALPTNGSSSLTVDGVKLITACLKNHADSPAVCEYSCRVLKKFGSTSPLTEVCVDADGAETRTGEVIIAVLKKHADSAAICELAFWMLRTLLTSFPSSVDAASAAPLATDCLQKHLQKGTNSLATLEQACALLSCLSSSPKGLAAVATAGSLSQIKDCLEYRTGTAGSISPYNSPTFCEHALKVLENIGFSSEDARLSAGRDAKLIISCLANNMESPPTSLQACKAVTALAHASSVGKEAILNAGGISLIADCLRHHASPLVLDLLSSTPRTRSSLSPSICQEASRAFSELFFESLDCQDAVAIRDAVASILVCLKQFTKSVPPACEKACACPDNHTLWSTVCTQACWALKNIAVSKAGQDECIAADALPQITSCLQNFPNVSDLCREACWAVRNIAASIPRSPTARDALALALPYIVASLKNHSSSESSLSPALCEEALWALQNIAGDAAGKEACIAGDAIKYVAAALMKYSSDSLLGQYYWTSSTSNCEPLCGRACTLLGILSSSSPTGQEAGLAGDAIPAIVSCLKNPTCSARICEEACGALDNFATSLPGQDACVTAGAIPIVASLLTKYSTTSSTVCIKALHALRSIAQCPAGQEACIASLPPAEVPVRLIVTCLNSESSDVRYFACWALNNVALSVAGQAACVAAGAVPLLVTRMKDQIVPYSTVCEMALYALRNIAHSDGGRDACIDAGVVPALVDAFASAESAGLIGQTPAPVAFYEVASKVISRIAVSTTGQQDCAVALSFLATCLERYTKVLSVCENALSALCDITSLASGRDAALAAKVVPFVVAGLKNHPQSSEICKKACGALCNMAVSPTAKAACITSQAVPCVAAVLKEYAATSERAATAESACEQLLRVLSLLTEDAEKKAAGAEDSAEKEVVGSIVTLASACLENCASPVVCELALRVLLNMATASASGREACVGKVRVITKCRKKTPEVCEQACKILEALCQPPAEQETPPLVRPKCIYGSLGKKCTDNSRQHRISVDHGHYKPCCSHVFRVSGCNKGENQEHMQTFYHPPTSQTENKEPDHGSNCSGSSSISNSSSYYYSSHSNSTSATTNATSY